MNQQENERFNYTYSAQQQAEIENIRKKYMPQEVSKMELLRRLDAGVNQKANTVALVVGIWGALIMGFGMSLAMSELGAALGLANKTAMFAGVAIGIVGLVCLSFAYPIYLKVIQRERERIAPEVLRLTEELMK